MDLRKEKFRIRNAIDQDVLQLQTWWNDGSVMAHAGYPNGLGITQEEIATSLEKDNEMHRRLIIEWDHQPIGEMSYRTPEDKVAEIGIKICDANQQNKGYGTIYLKILMAYLFIKMKYEKIILDTNLDNKRAQHVYEKLGFQKVRTNMDAWKNQLGEFQSSVDYEMTKDVYLEMYSE